MKRTLGTNSSFLVPPSQGKDIKTRLVVVKVTPSVREHGPSPKQDASANVRTTHFPGQLIVWFLHGTATGFTTRKLSIFTMYFPLSLKEKKEDSPIQTSNSLKTYDIFRVLPSRS